MYVCMFQGYLGICLPGCVAFYVLGMINVRPSWPKRNDVDEGINA